MSLLDHQLIIERIAINLSVIDLLSFIESDERVSKVLKSLVDFQLNYFSRILKNSLIIYDPSYIPENLLIENEPTPITCFNVQRTNDPKGTIMTILTQLKPFLIQLTKLPITYDFTDFDFDTFFISTPSISLQDKAKILVNLSKFIQLDDTDSEYHEDMNVKVRNLIKTFTRLQFDELKENFQREDYSIVNILVETLNILDQEDLIVEFFKQENRFPLDFFPDTLLDVGDNLQKESLHDVTNDLVEFFNIKSKIIDQCFGEQLPVMLIYIENIIEKDIISHFIQEQASKNISIVPYVYYELINEFVPKLIDSKNAGSSYKEIVTRFINLYFEPLIETFFEKNLEIFKETAIDQLKSFERETSEQAKIEQDHIYNSILTEYNHDQVKTNKFELLTSFTKIFNKSNKESNEIKFRVNFEILNKDLQNLKSFINFELCYQILESAKTQIEITSIFNKIENSIIKEDRVNQQIETIFILLVSIINKHHLSPGFEKAIELLNKYDPTEFKTLESLESLNTVEPLVKFTELINVGDLIQQMIEIFYENELSLKKIVDKNDFLNNANQSKKKFENTLDNYVANGLNTGIDKLMAEIEFLFNTLQLPNDFNPKEQIDDILITGPTKCAVKVVELLSNHINLLNGSTEKGIIDIFQQEIGERFFRIIVKNMKKRQISNDGSIILICDLNLYYDFVVNTLKQKNITPYFISLKEIGQLYLISTEDSKELGKLIGDLSRFNGIFKQEEIYEFVQQRNDWLKIKKDVEKSMYGLGLIDCTIM